MKGLAFRGKNWDSRLGNGVPVNMDSSFRVRDLPGKWKWIIAPRAVCARGSLLLRQLVEFLSIPQANLGLTSRFPGRTWLVRAPSRLVFYGGRHAPL